MQRAILAARNSGTAILSAASIECAIRGLGMPAGCGGAGLLDRNVEGHSFPTHPFAVPAVSGIAFGAGFGCAAMRGSAAQRPSFYLDEGIGRQKPEPTTTGGVNGGITNGMPVVFEVAMRPTPSIARPQDTVNMAEGTGMPVIQIKGATIPALSTAPYRSSRLPVHWPYVSFWKGGSAWSELDVLRGAIDEVDRQMALPV